jgi:RNA polymerase sigma factor (sigma-70 family)
VNPSPEPDPGGLHPLSADQAAAVEKLYRAASPELFSRALFLSQGNRTQAEDLIQLIFQAAITRWSTGGNPVGYLAYEDQMRWLYGVLNYKAADAFRSRSRESPMPDLDPDWLQAPHDTAHHALCSRELDRALLVMKRMPRVRHVVASLRLLSGLPTREVAAMLGIEQSTVRWHLKRAREELCKEVGPILPVADDEPGDDGLATGRAVTS